MSRGRKADPESIYKVRIHTNSGRRYASTQPYTVDENGRKHYRHKHWGTVDEDLRFHPGMAYHIASPEERARLIFPEDWDLSETLPSAIAHGGEEGALSYAPDDVDRLWGSTWFMGEVARSIGLRDDILTVLEGNTEMANQVLTLAVFPLLGTMNYGRLARWQRSVKTFTEVELTRGRISFLLQNISARHRIELFRLRTGRVENRQLGLMETDPLPHLIDFPWIKGKPEGTREIYVCSFSSETPIFHTEIPTEMPKRQVLDLVLSEISEATKDELYLVVGRNDPYDSIIEQYIKEGPPSIIRMAPSHPEVLERIEKLKWSQGRPEAMTPAREEPIYYREWVLDPGTSGPRRILCLFFDPGKRGREEHDLEVEAETQMESIRKTMEGHRKYTEGTRKAIDVANPLVSIEWGPSGIVSGYRRKTEEIDARRMTLGFDALEITGSRKMGAMEALRRCRMMEEQRMNMLTQKAPMINELLMDYAKTGRTGLMFIWYVGITLMSHLRAKLETNRSLKSRFSTPEDIVDEMRTIRCIENGGRVKYITPLSEQQLLICKAFGFTPPTTENPLTYEKRPRKRGRPLKMTP